ncbi:MAG: hypothetical protein KO463_00895 [Candidatus Methanofastidiosa archaeon]|nr:hypothetical protein [Candidatus Methanofastidiosa archaeon]
MKRTMFPMRFSTSWFLVVMMVLSLCAASGVVLAVVIYDTTYVDDNGPLGGNHFQDIAAALAQTEAGVPSTSLPAPMCFPHHWRRTMT